MFNQTTHSLKGLFILSGLLFASTSWADETTNAPGSACVATGSSTLTVRSDGEAENQTASWLTAICPVERPVGAGTLTTVFNGRVFLVDQHPVSDACCRVVSKNPGGAKINGAWQCSAGSSTAYQMLDLVSITDSFTFSAFYIECQLPASSNGAASRIQMYRGIQQ